MRYYIKKGVEIRAENAAKPTSQTSKFAEKFISGLEHVEVAADYGTGKGRYQQCMLMNCNRLDLVDSVIQIKRSQKIFGAYTSLEAHFQSRNDTRVITTKQLISQNQKYDRIFCLNVLPIVPIISLRYEILKRVKRKLRKGGELVLAAQYRNSDFTRMRNAKNAITHADGFLLDSLRGFSFFALLPPSKLETMLKVTGFSELDQVLNEGTVYIRARS